MTTEGEYDVFISHAWEDKANFVEPLVAQLIELGLRPWYDDMSLDLGDSLRENIDSGLSSSKYGVVVLSPAFFSKRWPERELNGLVQKAMGEGRKVILPVWHEVTHEEVASYSLPLADLIAAHSSDGAEAVAESIARVVRGRGGAADPTNMKRSHDLAKRKLLASAKKMIADPTEVVGVHELADALARDAFTHLTEQYERALEEKPDIANLWSEYETILHATASLSALTAHLGHPAHHPTVLRVTSILTRNPGPITGRHLDQGLWQYPSAYLVYATCLAALQRKRMDLVVDMLDGLFHAEAVSRERVRLVEYIKWDKVAAHAKDTYSTNEGATYKTPLSEHLFQQLSSLVGAFFIDDDEFEHTFDVFEYTLGLVHSLRSLRVGRPIGWIPHGRYLWRDSWHDEGLSTLKAEVRELGLTELAFGGNEEWFEAATDHSREWAQRFQF